MITTVWLCSIWKIFVRMSLNFKCRTSKCVNRLISKTSLYNLSTSVQRSSSSASRNMRRNWMNRTRVCRSWPLKCKRHSSQRTMTNCFCSNTAKRLRIVKQCWTKLRQPSLAMCSSWLFTRRMLTIYSVSWQKCKRRSSKAMNYWIKQRACGRAHPHNCLKYGRSWRSIKTKNSNL